MTADDIPARDAKNLDLQRLHSNLQVGNDTGARHLVLSKGKPVYIWQNFQRMKRGMYVLSEEYQ